MFAKLPILCFGALMALYPVTGLRAADENPPGIFDFSDLDIVVDKPGAPKTGPAKPPETKPAEPPALSPDLPAEASALMKRLANYISTREEALSEKIVETRKAAAEKLAASAAKAEGPDRRKYEAASQKCLTLRPTDRLAHPVAPSALPVASMWALKGGKVPRTLEHGGRLLIGTQQRGNWFWVDEAKGIAVYDWWGGDDCDLLRLSTGGADTLSNRGVTGQLFRVESPEMKPALEASGVLATTAMQELQWRKFLDADFDSKRSRVHDWLIAQARTTKGDAGNAILKEAAALETKKIPGTGPREKPERVAGIWLSKTKQRYQFFPDGRVGVNDNPEAGTWRWAKVRNWNTILVTIPGPTTTEIFFGRLASEPGKLRIYAFGVPPGNFTKVPEEPVKF